MPRCDMLDSHACVKMDGIYAPCCVYDTSKNEKLSIYDQLNNLTLHSKLNVYSPYGKQSINYSDIKSVEKVLKSNFITQGPKISEFEKK